MTPLLTRQLKRLGLSADTLPSDVATWQSLLSRVDSYYEEIETGRELLERSIQISSREMAELTERIRAQGELALAREQGQFGAVLQALSEGLLVLDDGMRIRSANAAALRLLELEESHLLGRSLCELLVDKVGGHCSEEAHIRERLGLGTGYQSDSMYMRRSGQAPLPVALTLDPVSTAGSAGVVVAFRDLSLQHASEAVRADQERLLRRQHAATLRLARSPAIHDGVLDAALLEITSVCASVLRVQRASVWWLEVNSGARELVCAKLFESDTDTYSDGQRLRAGDFPAYFAALALRETVHAPYAREDPRTCEFRDGYLVPLGIHSMLDVPIQLGDRLLGVICLEQTGAPKEWSIEEEGFALVASNFVSLAYEAADRQRAQREVEHGQRFLDSVVENLPLVVFVKDADSLEILRVNRATEALTGWLREDLIGKTARDMLPSVEAEVVIAQERAILQGDSGPVQYEEQVATPRGGMHLLTRKLAIRDHDGRPRYLLGISEDVTERNAAAQALVEAKDEAEQANRAKTQFLANMSHEIRTPMNAVLGLSELLLDSPISGLERQRARGIHQAATALLQLVNDILDVSRIEASRIELTNASFDPRGLVEQIDAMLRPLAEVRSLDLRVHLDAQIPEIVVGDEGRVRQVLINLVGNALKFTEKGGVTLTVGAKREGDKWLTRFSVVDTGPGIPEPKLPLLFQPFTQLDSSQMRRHGGSGLGLFIARELALLMGGDITVQRTTSVGSEFCFEVPFEIHRPSSAKGAYGTSSGAEATPTRRLNILVAEDNLLNQEVIRAMLEGAGHRVVLAEDGQRAVSVFALERFDLVLMDCQMPNLDGVEAARRVRTLESEHGLRPIPIVALTASAMANDRDRFAAAGMTHFLAKPFSKKSLLGVLADCEATSS